MIAFFGLYIFFVKVDQLDANIEIPQVPLVNQFGDLKSFGNYKGKVLLVDFWFKGCKPCIEEMKFFPELLKKYESELAIVSISIDPKEETNYLLEHKPIPFDFLISDNENWTFYNDNRKVGGLVNKLNVVEYPTYLLFDKEGDLISTPMSGIAGVENEFSGIFGLDLAFKTERHKEVAEKFPYLIIPYTIIVFLILLIQFLVFGIKKLISK